MLVKKDKVEKWDVFEVELKSEKSYENPFKDVSLEAYFNNGLTKKKVKGFYDKGAIWKIRFMPEAIGNYT